MIVEVENHLSATPAHSNRSRIKLALVPIAPVVTDLFFHPDRATTGTGGNLCALAMTLVAPTVPLMSYAGGRFFAATRTGANFYARSRGFVDGRGPSMFDLFFLFATAAAFSAHLA